MCKLRFFAFFIAAAFFLIPSVARAQATPNEIKLLTQNTGWALLHGRLYWTNDFGQDWRDITPKAAASGRESIADVFFLDTSDGWALLRNPESDGGRYGGWSFELAATEDGGITWSVTPVAIPNWDPKSYTLGGSGTLDFVDASHGWVDLSLQSSPAANWGRLLATSDGGATWRTVPAPIGFGDVRFISTQTGWGAGGPGGTELVVTRDGGKTWQHVRVQAPPQFRKAIHASYLAPLFTGALRGFLPVMYTGAAPGGGSEALGVSVFGTTNGGRTWHLAAVLKSAGGSSGGAFSLAATDETLVVPDMPWRGRLSISELPTSGPGAPALGVWPLRSQVGGASFASPNQGWVLAGKLYATADGGQTWTDITPKTPSAPPHHGFVPPTPHF